MFCSRRSASAGFLAKPPLAKAPPLDNAVGLQQSLFLSLPFHGLPSVLDGRRGRAGRQIGLRVISRRKSCLWTIYKIAGAIYKIAGAIYKIAGAIYKIAEAIYKVAGAIYKIAGAICKIAGVTNRLCRPSAHRHSQNQARSLSLEKGGKCKRSMLRSL